MIFAACYLSVETFNSYKETQVFGWIVPGAYKTTGNLVAFHFYLE